MAIYFVQERLIFPAPNIAVEGFEDEIFERVAITTPDGEELFALHHPSEKEEATILVFHGNGDAAIFQKEKGAHLAEQGFGVLLVEYRGYPGSSGEPSETGLFIDGQAAYDFIINQKPQRVGLYAHSLGTGVAVNLATERDVFAVVLESPFDSLMAVAQDRMPWLPVSLLLKHKFRSDLRIQNVTAPILIMHGNRDGVVPIKHGKLLHDTASSKAIFEEIKNAGHNDLANFGTVEKAVKFFKHGLK
ncbi:MAG: alpha/beta hydrolase [Hyphomicrobiales bacterium]